MTALQLADFHLVDDSAQADVFVLNGIVPADATVLARARTGEAGLVLLLGPGMTSAQVSELLSFPMEMTRRDDPASLTALPLDDPLLTEIPWNEAPQVRERSWTLTPISSVRPWVTVYEDGVWILWEAYARRYVFSAFLEEYNPQIQEWAYFNYLIYHMVERAGGGVPLSFAYYYTSPMLHALDSWWRW